MRSVARVACGWLFVQLLSAGVAAASSPVDVDRDGIHDRVIVRHDSPSLVTVWLSETGKTQFLHSPGALVRIVASDLDGDRDTDLVAIDEAGQLTVWTNRDNRFKRVRSQALQRPVGLIETGTDLSRPDVRLFGPETHCVEKQLTWRDFGPPARAPSPVSSRDLSPRRRFARAITSVPTSPRPPPLA